MHKININFDTLKWKKNIQNIEKITKLILKKSVKSDKKFKNKKTEISVLLTDTKKMEKLNLKFRKKKKDTDILSFPSENSVFYEKKI